MNPRSITVEPRRITGGQNRRAPIERLDIAPPAAKCCTTEGGGIGPDLTAVAARFASRDVLESIIEPSKVVSEQFQNTTVVLQNGGEVTGRIVEENAERLVFVPSPFQPDSKVIVKKSDVKSRSASKLSPMPEGLVNVLSEEEILDLIAYLESGGSPTHQAFKKSNNSTPHQP